MTKECEGIKSAEIRVFCKDFGHSLVFFTKHLGLRLDEIFPADDPAVAVVSGLGLTLRLERNGEPGTTHLHLRCQDPEAMKATLDDVLIPEELCMEFADDDPPMEVPRAVHAFSVRRLKDNQSWVIGRAGMHYRDLIPERLGGRIIASHIRIPGGGPVPDSVHFHSIGFQLIYCHKGWVELVYEDQGAPFILKAGDCVTQPPRIRHRVLEASKDLEVVEIGVPAEHRTTLDHTMELPNEIVDTDRLFDGQKFCRFEAKKASWAPHRLKGFEACETGVCDATRGLASVQIVRSMGIPSSVVRNAHDADILFSFVTKGSVTLNGENRDPHELHAGDALVIPPSMVTHFAGARDLEWLEIAMPGNFETTQRDL